MIGLISLGAKRMGARSAGNPHAACDVEGAGNVAQVGILPTWLARQSSTLPLSSSEIEDGYGRKSCRGQQTG
jgi:hypothetical protein